MPQSKVGSSGRQFRHLPMGRFDDETDYQPGNHGIHKHAG